MAETTIAWTDYTASAAWLAGLLEGEGCFQATDGRGRHTSVMLRMTDRDVVERAAIITAGIVGCAPLRIGTSRPGSSGRKPSYYFVIYGAGALSLALTLRPFLCQRRSQRVAAMLANWRPKAESDRLNLALGRERRREGAR